MLRINLLPAYLGEQKKVRLAIIGASALFAAVLIGMLGYSLGVINPQAKEAEDKATAEETEQARVQKISDDAKEELRRVQPIMDKVNFVEAVQFHNTVRQEIFANAARYTIRPVEYNGMSVNGNVLSINAFAKSLSDLGRFYLTMFGNPDLTAVSIQGIPSWPPANRNIAGASPFNPGGDAQGGTWFPVQMTGTLVRPVVTPQLPGSLFSGQGGGGGGFGGGFGPPGGFTSGSFPGGSGGPASSGRGAKSD